MTKRRSGWVVTARGDLSYSSSSPVGDRMTASFRCLFACCPQTYRLCLVFVPAVLFDRIHKASQVRFQSMAINVSFYCVTFVFVSADYNVALNLSNHYVSSSTKLVPGPLRPHRNTEPQRRSSLQASSE